MARAKRKTREHRPLGGSIVRRKGQPGALYGQLRRDGKRLQMILVTAADAAKADAAAKVDEKAKNATKLAEERLAAWALKVANESPTGDGLRAVTVKDFLPEFLKTIKGRVSDAHYKDVEQRCTAFATFAGDRPTASIGADVVADYFAKLAKAKGQGHKVPAPRAKDGSVVLDEKGEPKEIVVHGKLSPFTARNHRNALSLLWKCAIDRRAATVNIWSGNAAKLGRGQQFVPVNLTNDEVEAIVARVSPPVRPIIAFLAETGLRLGEARALTWQRVERDFSTVTVAKSKSGRSRAVPTTERAKAVLADRWAVHVAKTNGPDLVFDDYSRSRVYVCFKDAVKGAGVDRRTRVHDLRHHVGSALGAENVPIDVIMSALGHSQLSTVQRYLHHGAVALTEAFHAVEAAKTKTKSAAEKSA